MKIVLLFLLLGFVVSQKESFSKTTDNSSEIEEESWFDKIKGAFHSLVETIKYAFNDGEVKKTSEPSQIITTNSGPIKGMKVTPDGDGSHYEFLGIPYAQPPVGKLRFMAPQPVKPWSEVLEAFQDGPECTFVDTGLGDPAGTEISEDCLSLNVFTNAINITLPLQPVMVFIHGGGFNQGSKNIYRMKNLLEEDVVLVAMNYRLHALGFLSFGNNLVSGNMGLKDQQLAIQWVRDNIQFFGGDPNKITIFGESAGGISVALHVLSPWNNNTLSGAIAQSGHPMHLHFDDQNQVKEYAKNAAVALGCPTGLDESTLDCLQAIPDFGAVINKISDDDDVMFSFTKENRFYYWPVIDSYAKNPFIPLDPIEALKEGMFNKIPYMSGTCAYEGAMNVGFSKYFGFSGLETLHTIEIPAKSGFNLNYGQGEMFNNAVLEFYNQTTGTSLFEQEKPAIDFWTDVNFLSADQKTVELMSKHVTDVYNYHLTQPTQLSFLMNDLGLTIEYTPMHADDLVFQVSETSIDNNAWFNDEEKATAKYMARSWANFAKHGNPSPTTSNDDSPTWLPLSPNTKVCNNYIYSKRTKIPLYYNMF